MAAGCNHGSRTVLSSFILQNHWRLLGLLEEFTSLQENVIFLTQKFAAHGTCQVNFVIFIYDFVNS
jgi:hypothetical protein